MIIAPSMFRVLGGTRAARSYLRALSSLIAAHYTFFGPCLFVTVEVFRVQCYLDVEVNKPAIIRSVFIFSNRKISN